MTKLSTHCQICGRDIKVVPGFARRDNLEAAPQGGGKLDLIAHHGYQRPYGEGWQTGSCFGARFRPYEAACDALPPAIEALERHIGHLVNQHWAHYNMPPAVLVRRSMHYKQKPEEQARPADFNTHGYMFCAYGRLFQSRSWELENAIKHTNQDLRDLRKRLANWRGK